MTGKPLQLKRRRFGRWVVVRKAESRRRRTGHGTVAFWLCRCECGTMKEIASRELVRGNSRSCGCLARDRLRERRLKHSGCVGHKDSREYSSWHNTKQRCYNPNHHAFQRYGGTGIKMCKKWFRSFAAFLKDMGRRPAGTTLDRYPDPAGNYEPRNCRWATPKQQGENKRRAGPLQKYSRV